jgi:hypothetical protein
MGESFCWRAWYAHFVFAFTPFRSVHSPPQNLTGYFEFEECIGTNPTLGIEIGETYTFVQKYPSNWYHPMGFSYRADGAHADEPELEPGVSVPADAPCTFDLSCPAPMYYKNGIYLGNYSNLPGQPRIADDDFGLDVYEPMVSIFLLLDISLSIPRRNVKQQRL